jgi:hypothetical protein
VICQRYFSDEDVLGRIKADFDFLIKRILESEFEYDLQLRHNSFNLYYKGKSLGKVSYSRKYDRYGISIHNKYVDDIIRKRFKYRKQRKDYLNFELQKKELYPFYRLRNLKIMSNNVRKIFFQEEVTFEQMIMTDNVDREDFIIIDRQIVEAGMRMDLLALEKKEGADYQFCVIEVKLGNNREPGKRIINQIEGYVALIEKHFKECKEGYEKNFKQKKELGLFDKNQYVRNLDVNIVSGVSRALVIGGYSGLAKIMIKELKKIDPSIRICQLKNIIDLSNC